MMRKKSLYYSQTLKVNIATETNIDYELNLRIKDA